MTKNNARLEDWFICTGYHFVDTYAPPDSEKMKLQGKTYSDSRADDVLVEFVDGHRIITTPVKNIDLENGVAVTRNTVYVLGRVDVKFGKWMEANNYRLEDYEIQINENNNAGS